ncbi:MAG: hypothetical protein JNL10_10680 [Verrucomicrobiales bacterium]|nr:hypothetical protein [Verrucomicrobiales bacterium]
MALTAADFWKWAATPELPYLGPGPRPGVMDVRELATRVDRFAAGKGMSSEGGVRLRAAALLYHDHHDPAHDIVQDLSDADGALIHAILHRREPDYWNAKYWFRRVDMHPVYLSLGRRVRDLPAAPGDEALARRLTLPGAFDPFALVDACEQEERSGDSAPTVLWLRRIQHAEFEELVAHLLAT